MYRNPNSFSQLKELTSHIESNKFPYLKKILVSNKIDLENTRQVTSNELKEYVDSNQPLDIQEISIKNSEHINELLNKINAAINQNKNEIPTNIVSESLDKRWPGGPKLYSYRGFNCWENLLFIEVF